MLTDILWIYSHPSPSIKIALYVKFRTRESPEDSEGLSEKGRKAVRKNLGDILYNFHEGNN